MPAHLTSPDDRKLHRQWIGGAVKTLIVICGGDWPSDPRLEREMGKMWMDDLEGFTQEAIETAIAEWRRTEPKRPTPAGIRKLCIKHTPRPPAEVYEPKNPEPPSEDQKAKIRELTGRAFPELRRFEDCTGCGAVVRRKDGAPLFGETREAVVDAVTRGIPSLAAFAGTNVTIDRALLEPALARPRHPVHSGLE